MSKFEESNFYKALQDFFINADKKTFLQFLAEFYNRTESIIDKNNIQDDLIKELRELYLEFNEKGIDENVVIEKVNYFLEQNSLKINDIISKLNTNTNNIKNISSQMDTNVRELENSKASKVELDVERKRIDSFTSLPEGSTTGDAELIDGRIGVDGVTYENIGSAIREQFKNVNKTTDDLLKSYKPVAEEVDISILENWIQADGTISNYNNYKHVEISNIKTNDTFLLKCQVGSNIRAYVIKNSGGHVTRVYNQESYDTKHDYDLKVTINSDEEGGTLYINTFSSNYIGVKKYNGIEIAPTPEVLDARIGADGVTYENIGTSIREQFKKVNKATDDLSNSFVSTFENLSINVLENWIETTGNSSDYGNFKHVEIAGIKTGNIYKIKNQCGGNVRAYVLKNASGEVVITAPEQSYGTYNNYTMELTIPYSADGGTLYINTFTDTYIGVQTVNGKAIDSLQLANKNIFIQSNLYGKKIVFFGDSITANSGSWGDGDTIRAKYKMTGVNYAVGGMTYSVRSDSNDTNNIYLRMQSKLSDILDADYICFQGATNDAFRGFPIGEMLDENDFTTEGNTSTFAGAFEMACRLLRTQVPGAKLLYLANIKIPRSRNLVNYVNMAKRICDKYSIKYLDLWNDSGMCPAIQSFNDKYYYIDSSVSAEHGDQTHPTIEGYKVHLNDKVDFALNSL